MVISFAKKEQRSGLIELVSILNDGQYHDGTTLGETLGLTRSGIWKIIKKLDQYGIQIDSVKGKGYALLEPLILLHQKKITEAINSSADIQIFETIDSTNAYLKKTSRNETNKICLAEQQTQGKGRLQRTWHSPFGKNIYFSCSYFFRKDLSELAGLSLVIGLAVTKALETYSLPHALHVKWPNDVYYDHKKISGNLIEIQAESHGACYAIIGIGINANMLPDDNVPIPQAWTSLRMITGHYIDRNVLCATLIDTLFLYLKRFEEAGLTDFIEEWNAADYLFNQDITVQHNHQMISGRAQGIDPLGHLVIKLKNGSSQTFSSGDTKLIKK